jgi:hypothetical protein
MLAEEQASQHIKTMLLKSSVKAGKIATHLNLQRAEAEEQEQEKREVQRVTEKEQNQANKVESVSEEEQPARARAKAEGREEARRGNTKGVPSSVIEKRVAERAKIEDILRNVVAYHIAPRYIWCPPQVRD